MWVNVPNRDTRKFRWLSDFLVTIAALVYVTLQYHAILPQTALDQKVLITRARSKVIFVEPMSRTWEHEHVGQTIFSFHGAVRKRSLQLSRPLGQSRVSLVTQGVFYKDEAVSTSVLVLRLLGNPRSLLQRRSFLGLCVSPASPR
ncbi:hypothetical protein RRG08_060043 [Elysia crispata]|uniref:Uncharacterized protein n=1 Tax=Elysia crispata TaxID=231223 RepID=A0AAE1ADS3_9GAST|nr:hypothetical protein RRG08_060043 [Elysia crispata]